MNKANVLVVPAGTEIAHEVMECLAYSRHWNVIGANSVKDHSEVNFQNIIWDIPFVNHPDFPIIIDRLVGELEIDFVVPTHDDAIFHLSKVIKQDKFLGPAPHLAQILRFKSKTLEILEGVIPVPRLYRGDDDFTFPLFLKPDRGQGSRGAIKVSNSHELADINFIDNIIQEYLPGREFTVDCFSNRDSRLIFCAARERLRVAGGIATRMRCSSETAFEAYAHKITECLKLKGAWFFQMREDDKGQLKLLEVSNRIAGSSGHQRLKGINLIDAWLHQSAGKPISFTARNKELEIESDRALYFKALPQRLTFDTVFVDFDDTIYDSNANKVNYRLIGLLFALKINKRFEINLITRHAGDLMELLYRLALVSLFKNIYHLTRGEAKSTYIPECNVLVVDDSFSERREITFKRPLALCIPPESLDLIESLIQKSTFQ